jgi:Ni,Fe-hydrogenase III small subunit
MIKEILKNLSRKKEGLAPEELLKSNPGPELVHATEKKIPKAFGRSVRIRQVSAGSCNACEWECTALTSPVYDVQRFSVDFVASPRHADIVLVSGPVSAAMAQALKKTWLATPAPKLLIACGDCAKDGGIYKGSYAVTDGVENVLPVDSFIPGCPPCPAEILAGIMKTIEACIKE